MNGNKKLELKRLFKDRSYMSFWFATSFSMTASNLIQYVLSLYVLNKTGSGTIFASMLSITIFPRLLLTPVAGVQGDRVRRLQMMKVVMFISGLFMLFFSIWSTFYGDLSLILIYVLVVVLEIIEVFYQAAESAIITEIVKKELLNEAVSLSKIDDGIVYVAAPAVGTVIYKLLGVNGGLWLTSFLFFVSFCLNFFIKTSYYKKPKNIEKKSFWSNFNEGIAVIKNHEFMKHFIFISPLMAFFFATVYNVVVAHLFLVALDIGETAYGIYRSITASMVIFVPLFVIPIVKRVETKKLVITSTLIVTVTLVLLAILTGSVYYFGEGMKKVFIVGVTIIDSFVIACMMPVHMSISVLYHKTIPNEYRSRVLSVSRMLSMVAIPLGNMFFGVLTDLLPPYVNIMIAAVGVFICYLLYRRTFRYEQKIE